MMNGRNGNSLIVIENGILTTYELDNKNTWELGRTSKDNVPDIRLHTLTVSRKHGTFQNTDGVWFYLDHNGKNGTVYNGNHIDPGLKGRVRPVMLSDGDVFVFGGSKEEAVINGKTVWAMFMSHSLEDCWRVVDTKGLEEMGFDDGHSVSRFHNPDKGTVVEKDYGIGIYMGDVTYLNGDMELTRA